MSGKQRRRRAGRVNGEDEKIIIVMRYVNMKLIFIIISVHVKAKITTRKTSIPRNAGKKAGEK